MQDAYHVPEHRDFSTVVNALTQGLRTLPTDYVTRVKNFLMEYLGTFTHPVPFGGRTRDFEFLDTWLNDNSASPYMLLAAPAGRGKSALLLRWCQRLLTLRDVAIAYFPVSIRFRTNLASVAFPTIVALLASIHGEQVPTDPNISEEVWRALLMAYLTRPLQDGRTCVLVLDGIDEAADWDAATLFPQKPPASLRVVVSARYLANDEDTTAWLQRLDWMQSGLATTLELHPLDRTGIASVLHQMGFPLDVLSTHVNLVSELYRLSEGDPLLVRLYVDDLWERGEAAVRLQPEDLRGIQPGLSGYFERWWRDQRMLWNESAPEREQAAQLVLNLLAGALGPLSREDILHLLEGEANFTLQDFELHLASLARFVTGDGIRQGYVFSHPRLGNYFLEERLSIEERQAVERRFLHWGEQTVVALNEGRLAPELASPYIVQYYGAHLERSRADTPTLLQLISDGWRRAWEKLDRANAGFLGDVARAWRAAAREDMEAIQNGKPALYLGEEIRCLLSQVSVNSITNNISPRLMLEAVKTGIWTPAQGLACIRLILDLAPRARELVGLAPYVQEPLRTDILQEALDTVVTIKDEYARLDALVEIAPGLSEELLWQVIEIASTVEDEADRAGVLAELASALASHPALVSQILVLVQEMEEEEYQALALEGLASCFSEEQIGQVVEMASQFQDERDRTQTYLAILPYLAQELLIAILQEARQLQDGLLRMRLLTALVEHLPKQLQNEVVDEVLELEQESDDREYRVEVLVELAPFLDEKRLQEALEEIQLLWDESARAAAFGDVLSYLPQRLIPELLQMVSKIRSEEQRVRLLMQLLPRLPEDEMGLVLEQAQEIWDEGLRAEFLAQYALYAPKALLARLLEIIATIEDHGYRVWLLAELERPLKGKLKVNMLTAFEKIPGREERLQTLLAIAPRLSDAALATIFDVMLTEVFGFTWRFRRQEVGVDIITKLGSRLPEDWLPSAMNAVRSLTHEVYRTQALVALAPRLHDTLLSEALDIVRGIGDRARRSQVLEALVSFLPEERKAERVQEMLNVLQVIKDEFERSRAVLAYMPHLPAQLPSTWIEQALKAIEGLMDETHRTNILEALLPHIPEDRLERVLKILQSIQSEEMRARMLEIFLPHVPEQLFAEVLDTIYQLKADYLRVETLKRAVRSIPEHILVEMLKTLSRWRPDMETVEALATRVPEEFFPQFWKIASTIADERKKVHILAGLAPHVPEEFFPQFWKTIERISDEHGQLWVWREALPYLSEQMFLRYWQAALALKDRRLQIQFLQLLVQYVPSQLFESVWQDIQEIPELRSREFLLAALAPHVPHEFFLTYLAWQGTLSQQRLSAQILEALMPRVPEEHFPQFLRSVQELPNMILQERLLVALAAHTPPGFAIEVWGYAYDLMQGMNWIYTLKGLLPYVKQDELVETLRLIQAMPEGEEQIGVLDVIAPYLPEETCIMLLETALPLQQGEQPEEVLARATWEHRWQLRKVVLLLPRLSETMRSKLERPLIKAIRNLKVEEEQAWMLTRLAVCATDALLPEILDIIWSFKTEKYRGEVLEALLPSLPPLQWQGLLDAVMQQVQTSGDVYFAVEVLRAGKKQIEQSSPGLLYPVVHEVFRRLAQQTRRDTLAALTCMIPSIETTGGEQAIMKACSVTQETGYWWP